MSVSLPEAARPRNRLRRRTPVRRDPYTGIVRTAVVRFLQLCCLVSLPVLMLALDIRGLGNAVTEMSVVELSQLAMIVATVLAFSTLAWRREDDRRFGVLAAGLFACMVIREMDAALDLLQDGLWQVLATAVAVGCLTYSLRDRRSTLRGLANFLGSTPGKLMLLALAILLVYSRLIGMGLLWRGLLEEQYLRIFKNAVEESAELLGYVLILVSAISHATRRLSAPPEKGVTS